MSERLAQVLSRDGLVDASALDEAQRRQVVYEGSLDTNLLELGAIGEDQVLLGLGDAYRLPVGNKADVDRVEAHIPRIFPLQFSEAYRMVPFRLTGRNLSVLVNSEPDRKLFEKIRDRLQLHVNATVTTEARLHYAMHRLYSTRLLPRFESLLARLDGEPPRPLHAPPPGEHFLSWGLPSVRPDSTKRGSGALNPPDIAALLARLDTAPNRDAVVEILLDIAVSVFDFVCMFVVQGEHINGWRGLDPENAERIAGISIPVVQPSVFQTIYATHGHYLGPLERNDFNTSLLAQLGREWPRTALVAPILVRGKLVAVVYADNGARPVPSRRVSGLLMLAHRVGMCLERLIRRQKRLLGESREAPDLELNEKTITVQAPSATVPGPGESGNAREVLMLSEPEWVDEADFDVVEDQTETPNGEGGWDDVGESWNDALAGTDGEVGLSSNYVAFADVGDSPEESLADWQDVLVDAASASTEAGSEQGRARDVAIQSSVTWQDVIDEGRAAPVLRRESVEQHIEVAGTAVDTLDLLFDSLGALDGSTRAVAIEKLLAEEGRIDAQLRERFPGVLNFDLFDRATKFTSFEACGGMCALLARRGVSAAALVSSFLDSQDRDQRLIATYFFLAIRHPPSIEGLARRLFDIEPRIRFLAADALRGYAGEPTYGRVLQSLREQLTVPVIETQMTTVQVLGQLRDPRAVPSLIPLTVAVQGSLGSAAASALTVICAQAFGKDVTAWGNWWRSNYMRPREAWLVTSLRHPNQDIQRIAFTELQLLTGYEGTFDPESTDDQKEPVIRVWESWLSELENARRQAEQVRQAL